MVDWSRFQPTDFEYDFDRNKLSVHGVSFEEAVIGGRLLKIIFQLKPNKVVRIITGWPL